MKRSLLLLFFIISISAFGQKYKISGIIKDDSTGEALSFTSAYVNMNGVVANKKGEFMLIVSKGDVIHLSRIGYSSYNYVVQKSASLEIRLKKQVCTLKVSNSNRISFTAPEVIDGKISGEKFSIDSIPAAPKPAPDEKREDDNKIFTKVEMFPAIMYADTARLARLLSSNTKPRGKRKGRLKLGFTVGFSGIMNLYVLVPFKKGIDEQVIRNLLTRIEWAPPFQNGKDVGAYCELDFDVRVRKHLLILTLKHD